MKIAQARLLKVGDIVNCPADRGDAAYTGKVEHINATEQTHPCVDGPFLWVTVRNRNRNTVWPSNRISK